MRKFLTWLGRHRVITVLMAVALYLSIVTFHDEITQIAIKIRYAIGRDLYNAWLAWLFLALLAAFVVWVARNIITGERRKPKIILAVLLTGALVFSFRFLMVYNIEAIHFVEYMLVAILLVPVLKSFGETVFWVTILGVLDELFQYFFLVPEFEYFDFNDNILNLLGAGTGVIIIHFTDGNPVPLKPFTWYRSPAVLTGLSLLTIFCLLLLSGKMTIDPSGLTESSNWFSLNRKPMPDDFWKEAYPGRRFHILRPLEGITVMYLLFAGFFWLDNIHRKSHPIPDHLH